MTDLKGLAGPTLPEPPSLGSMGATGPVQHVPSQLPDAPAPMKWAAEVSEHLHYELEMLHALPKLWEKEGDQLGKNVVSESFATHVRNVIDFLFEFTTYREPAEGFFVDDLLRGDVPTSEELRARRKRREGLRPPKTAGIAPTTFGITLWTKIQALDAESRRLVIELYDNVCVCVPHLSASRVRSPDRHIGKMYEPLRSTLEGLVKAALQEAEAKKHLVKVRTGLAFDWSAKTLGGFDAHSSHRDQLFHSIVTGRSSPS